MSDINPLDHIGLVTLTAKRYRRPGVTMEELIQEGWVGLMRAVKAFDPTRGAKFSICASYWAHNQIREYVLTKTRTVRLPERKMVNAFKAGDRVPTAISMDSSTDSGKDWHEVLAGDYMQADEVLELKECRQKVRRAVKHLNVTPRNRKMLWQRMSGRTLEDIGQEHGLSRERVRVIMDEIFEMLRPRLAAVV